MNWFWIGGASVAVGLVLGLMFWLVKRAERQGETDAKLDGAEKGVDAAREAARIRESVAALPEEELNKRLKEWLPPPG